VSASFARELVALANTLGGKILLGVRDDGTVAGIRDSNEIRARIQDIARNCDPPVQLMVEPVGPVVVVTVRESGAKPVQCSDGFFWRQGSRTILPSLGSHRTVVADLNDLSMVVGSSGTAQGESHVFVWTPARGIVDLGAGLSADQANAVAINARGDIIGFTCHPGGAGLCWPGEGSRAILWRVKP